MSRLILLGLCFWSAASVAQPVFSEKILGTPVMVRRVIQIDYDDCLKQFSSKSDQTVYSCFGRIDQSLSSPVNNLLQNLVANVKGQKLEFEFMGGISGYSITQQRNNYKNDQNGLGSALNDADLSEVARQFKLQLPSYTSDAIVLKK